MPAPVRTLVAMSVGYAATWAASAVSIAAVADASASGASLSHLVSTATKDTALWSKAAMTGSSAAVMPRRASSSRQTRRSVGRPRR